MHVRKGDMVIVIAGNDRGKTGEIKRAYPKQRRVIVDGVNLRWKHKRATQSNPKGERVQEECSLDASNVQLLDPETGKGTRKRKPESKTKSKPKGPTPHAAACPVTRPICSPTSTSTAASPRSSWSSGGRTRAPRKTRSWRC